MFEGFDERLNGLIKAWVGFLYARSFGTQFGAVSLISERICLFGKVFAIVFRVERRCQGLLRFVAED